MEKSIYGSMLYIYDGMIKLKDLLMEVSDVEGFDGITKRLERECGTNDLMFGHCETWVDAIRKEYPAYEKVEVSLWSDNNRNNRVPCHVFLYKDGLFYDSDRPKGVKDPRDLPFFGGYNGVIDLHKVGKDKADTVHFSFK